MPELDARWTPLKGRLSLCLTNLPASIAASPKDWPSRERILNGLTPIRFRLRIRFREVLRDPGIDAEGGPRHEIESCDLSPQPNLVKSAPTMIECSQTFDITRLTFSSIDAASDVAIRSVWFNRNPEFFERYDSQSVAFVLSKLDRITSTGCHPLGHPPDEIRDVKEIPSLALRLLS